MRAVSDQEPKRPKLNPISRMGLYVFAVSAIIWVLEVVLSTVKFIVPWTALVGVIAFAYGFYDAYKKKELS